MSNRCLPPFAFSDATGCVPASGHWGGPSAGAADPHVQFRKLGSAAINLYALIRQQLIRRDPLFCPAARDTLRAGRESYFPYTSNFSTYCLRFPTSERLFAAAPHLKYSCGGTLLGIYRARAGGQREPVQLGPTVTIYETVPVVRIDLSYPSAITNNTYNVATGALLTDGFWWQDRSEAAPAQPNAETPTYPIRAGRHHGGKFNVLYGNGIVRTVCDDGTIAANTVPPGGALPDDGWHWASYSEPIWRLFDKPTRLACQP